MRNDSLCGVRDLLPHALQAALDAGASIMEVYASRDFGVEAKSDTSPLTRADRASHRDIVARLAATGFPVLSEESADIPYEQRKAWPQYWLIDPLDGTKEFIRRNGEFTVNIALIEDHRPVWGVVYAPVLRRLYWGIAGEASAWMASADPGASAADALRGCAPLRVSTFRPDPARGVRVVASRSHGNPETEAFIAALESASGSVHRVSIGSSLKICQLAEDAADLYPRIAPTMEWDTAAAQAVLEAAGGRVVIHDPKSPAARYLDPEAVEFLPLRYTKPNLLNPFFVASRTPMRTTR